MRITTGWTMRFSQHEIADCFIDYYRRIVHNGNINEFHSKREATNMNGTVGIAEIRNNMADAINRVAYAGERIVLQRRGKGIAALVSLDDLALLEAIEDREDAKAARRAMAEMKRKEETGIPLADVKERLGM